MSDRIVILGAAGDLTSRYLLPALATLHRDGSLPDGVEIIGAGRDDWSDDGFRDHAAEHLAVPGGGGADDTFLRRLRWRPADATDADDLRALLDDRPGVLYLALPPAVYPATIDALADAHPAEGTRLVVEKPFGTGQASARDLNQRIAAALPENSVFRVDHFLAKQTVQNLLGLRFANRLFEPIWHHANLSRVEIIWDETLGLEGRAGYYDHTGALRDMLQNHLLQLLALVAMEPPAGLGERDLRDRKVDVLRATRPLGPDETPRPSVRARYTSGTASGVPLPDYVDEPGVDPQHETETYAEMAVAVDNWRWAGVPFVLRSGKALAASRAEIALHFRPVPHSPFPDTRGCPPNLLRLSMNPDQISLTLNLNSGEDLLSLQTAALGMRLAPQQLPSYARLLGDVLAGDPTLSIRDDEAEESWRIVEPVLDSWRSGEVPLATYPAGSHGPTGSQVVGAGEVSHTDLR